LEQDLRRDYFRSLVGRRLTVLVEGPSEQNPAHWAGTSCRYAPCEIPADAARPGELAIARAAECRGDALQCTRGR
jgi:tRNA A37 methylthiotransferase MiaB